MFKNCKSWWARRRQRRWRAFLHQNKVILPAPDPRAKRNLPEAVP